MQDEGSSQDQHGRQRSSSPQIGSKSSDSSDKESSSTRSKTRSPRSRSPRSKRKGSRRKRSHSTTSESSSDTSSSSESSSSSDDSTSDSSGRHKRKRQKKRRSSKSSRRKKDRRKSKKKSKKKHKKSKDKKRKKKRSSKHSDTIAVGIDHTYTKAELADLAEWKSKGINPIAHKKPNPARERAKQLEQEAYLARHRDALQNSHPGSFGSMMARRKNTVMRKAIKAQNKVQAHNNRERAKIAAMMSRIGLDANVLMKK